MKRPRLVVGIAAGIAAVVAIVAVSLTGSTTASSGPEPVTPPPASPTPSATQPVEASGTPDASNTGVPVGMKLTPSGDVVVTKSGTVIQGLHVKGEITIEADNVTIRDTLVQSDTELSPIMVTSDSTDVLIERVEVDNMKGPGIGINFKPGATGGTVRQANIHSGADGVRISADGVTIEQSFIHSMHRMPDGHHDTIQIRAGDDVTIRNNNLQIYVPETEDPMNAAIQIGSLVGDNRISNLVVADNLMNGGNFTINGGKQDVDSAVYRGNRFGRDFRFGIRGNMEAASVWESSNVWDDSREPAE